MATFGPIKSFEDVYVENRQYPLSIISISDADSSLYNGLIVDKINLNTFIPQLFSPLNDPPFRNWYIRDINAFKKLYVVGENLSDTYNIVYDYSYDSTDHFFITDIGQPIDYYDSRQFVLFSWNMYSPDITSVKNSGTELAADYKYLYKKYVATLPGNFGKQYFQQYTINNIESTSTIYKQKCTNAKYCVYYLNTYGGWNWMLFESNKQIKKYSNKFSSILDYNNSNKVYKIESETSYDLTSLFLTDEGSEKLKQLYISPRVFLHVLDTGEIINVNVKTNTYTEKTFINQGRKYFTQNITLVEAKNKIIY